MEKGVYKRARLLRLVKSQNECVGECSRCIEEEVPPSRDVMVKKPVSDGTHLKKGRVVVCGNFQEVQPGEDTCKHTVISDVANAYFIGVIATLGSSVMGCVNSILVRPVAGRTEHTVSCRLPNVLVRLGLVKPGAVRKFNKPLYGLRTPKA